MRITEKISHAAERKAFETILDNLIQKGQTQDAGQIANDLVNMVQKLHSDVWSEKSFQTLHMLANEPDGKWAHYVQRLIRDNDPYILKTFLTNAVYEGGIRGYHVAQETAAKYDINVPWLILMDPTSACNMHCTGCWAAEYGHKQSLTFEEMDRILTEAKELGTHACLFTGGEPLLRKKDIIRLCEKHRDIAFHAFTNGTLIDEEFCQEMLRVGNFFVSISVEGFEEANDGRRGNGHFQKALDAMELMHSHRIPFGVSICYTSQNYKVVTSDEFLDLLISKGCVFAWYFHYMPVGINASTDLLLTPEQRTYMKDRVREIQKISQEPVSLETPIGEEEDSQLGDFIEDSQAIVPPDAASFSMLQEQLTQVLDSLADRERKVIELRFGLVDGHPRTLEEVGREFGVTRERIRQIESKTLAKLRHPSRSSKLKDYIES